MQWGCRDLDGIEDRCKRLELALRGVFAGNVFDLGAQGTADMHEKGEVRFTADSLPDISATELLPMCHVACNPSSHDH